jgi:hypothetical protein
MDQEPRRRAEGLRHARNQREGKIWVENTTHRFRDGYNYFGRYSEKVLAFFEKHIGKSEERRNGGLGLAHH